MVFCLILVNEHRNREGKQLEDFLTR